jgi:hypothetical protein
MWTHRLIRPPFRLSIVRHEDVVSSDNWRPVDRKLLSLPGLPTTARKLRRNEISMRQGIPRMANVKRDQGSTLTADEQTVLRREFSKSYGF